LPKSKANTLLALAFLPTRATTPDVAEGRAHVPVG
jgi:hypothetical protein